MKWQIMRNVIFTLTIMLEKVCYSEETSFSGRGNDKFRRGQQKRSLQGNICEQPQQPRGGRVAFADGRRGDKGRNSVLS